MNQTLDQIEEGQDIGKDKKWRKLYVNQLTEALRVGEYLWESKELAEFMAKQYCQTNFTIYKFIEAFQED